MIRLLRNLKLGGGRNVLSLSLMTFALAACQNNEEAPASSNQLQVSVRTEQPAATRAMVETTTLPSGSSIGITVTENTADATTYDGQTFNNVQYSSSDGIVEKSTNARDMGTVLKAFNAASDQNQGFDDWYIPALGQLAIIHLYMTEINEALTAIGGSVIKDNLAYWSSTESNERQAWCVLSSDGEVKSNWYKYSSYQVRFVRNLTPPQ